MATHPELQAEQAYVDFAYSCLEQARTRVLGLRDLTTLGPGGTHQARYESEIVEDTIRARMTQLQLGDVALVFGRIDRAERVDDSTDRAERVDDSAHRDVPIDEAGEHFYIGRLAVADSSQEPVVVDWRAPIAEPFYRATGRAPMGLTRRRHFVVKGREILGIEDETFGGEGSASASDGGIVGQGALLAALESSRSGYLGDIVATIQSEQDEIIRSELGGVLVVQGGPGTGKTVVALHRAAYLLYTHRFPLEGQGVLVVGPNRLYLRYVERVLPSLGEAGVELAVMADLVPEETGDERDGPEADLVKGDLRMASVMARAVRDRQRPLREELVVGFGLLSLRCSVAASEQIVRSARRRSRSHNAGRRFVETALFEELARSARAEIEPTAVRDQLRRTDDVRAALEWMWPVLSPSELLRDLFGSRALVRSAARGRLGEEEQSELVRPREVSQDGRWTTADVPLLDEARDLLGPPPRIRALVGDGGDDGGVRTYGHIVVDEVQDLSPMQLRMLARRSLGGSMTVVGDIAQATGQWAPSTWPDVLAHLVFRKEPRMVELSIGYRTPAAIMTLANRVLAAAAPDLKPPRAVRTGDEPPEVVRAAPERLASEVAAATARVRDAVGDGNVAVLSPDSLVDVLDAALTGAGIEHGRATRTGLETRVTIVPVRLVKGLELDGVVVVEPARIVSEEPQGLRSLYVALTRATRRLAVVHAEDLPEPLVRETDAAARGSLF